jgi:hypothetical protein
MSASRELPLLMTAANALAVREGRKTQTRRLHGLDYLNEAPDTWRCTMARGLAIFSRDEARDVEFVGPRYQVGDRLWIQERWASAQVLDHLRPSQLPTGFDIEFAAGGGATLFERGRWRSPLFLPKVAARTWVRVTKVRCERVGDISAEDAEAEGIQPYTDDGITTFKDYLTDEMGGCSAPQSFRTLWESIHGVGAWERNDWVWVYSFELDGTKGTQGTQGTEGKA